MKNDIESSCSLMEKTRIILRNPDGSITHCLKEGGGDNEKGKTTRCLKENISISDEDLRYIIDVSTEDDYPFLIRQIIALFRNYINVFIIIKACQVFLSYYLIAELYLGRQGVLLKINDLLPFDEKALVWVLISISVYIALCAVIAFIMIRLKNLDLMKLSSYLTCLSAMLSIPMCYMHFGYLFLFSLHILLYSLNKFVINLVASVLFLPVQNAYYQPNYNTITV